MALARDTHLRRSALDGQQTGSSSQPLRTFLSPSPPGKKAVTAAMRFSGVPSLCQLPVNSCSISRSPTANIPNPPRTQGWVSSAPTPIPKSYLSPRPRNYVITSYRNNSNDVGSGTTPTEPEAAGRSAVQAVTSTAVTAQDIFDAARTNMPSPDDGSILGQAGRWERWAAPTSDQVDRILISSGYSVYAFQPGAPPGQNTDSALTVHVFELPDATPTSFEAVQKGDKPATKEETRMTNVFKVGDVFFEPRLPDLSKPLAHPAAGLRLWAANQHGFAMALTHLPQDLFQQQQQQGADGFKLPFIANLYVKHPSSTPGIGHRWGWNIQYNPAAEIPSLQHIHHTSLGLVAMRDIDTGMQPGVHQTELLSPIRLSSSIAEFMSQHPDLKGSATVFSYDNNGQLQRQDMESCTYSPAGTTGSSDGDHLESWYSSGGYTRVPRDLKSVIEAGQSVIIEAGAVIPRRMGSKEGGGLEGVTRWLLSYRAGDGQLESGRIEVYAT